MQCQNHEELEADFIVGNTRTGDQLFLCGPCTGELGLALAQQILPRGQILETLGVKETPAGNGKSAPAKPRRARPQKPTEATAAEPVEDAQPGESEMASAVADSGDPGV